MAGSAVLFCACTAPAVWARLSGATPRSARAAPGWQDPSGDCGAPTALRAHECWSVRPRWESSYSCHMPARNARHVARRPSTHTDAL